jgi:hypothetical protein
MKAYKQEKSNNTKPLKVRTSVRAGLGCPSTSKDGKPLDYGTCGPGGCTCIYKK